MRLLVGFLGLLFTAGTVLFLVGVAAMAGLIWHYSKDLPDYSQIQNYEPPVMTRVHAVDGSLLGEYSRERRLYLPIQGVPDIVIKAFLAVEDKDFYEHDGVDYTCMARAAWAYIGNFGSNRRPLCVSTITQQFARNFLLNEVSFARKIKEVLLARQIEKVISKDKILEIYLNEIYLGLGTYGITAASLKYFDKPVNELTIAEAAYLACLSNVHMPERLHAGKNYDRAIERRNYVIDRLQENGWISEADGDKARKERLVITSHADGANTFAGEYFAEEVRRDVLERFGEKLYEGGLSVRTTLVPKIQVMARKSMVAGLVKFDEQQGYRGPVSKLELTGDWGVKLAGIKSLSDVSPWRMAVVLETSDQSARIGFQPGRVLGGAINKQRETGLVTLDGVKWAKAAAGSTKGETPTSVSQVLQSGDVIYADPLYKDGHLVEGQYRLRQLPEVSGAMVAMDPSTGRVLAMVGGFSFDQSQFNRATLAYRPPGSSFKPIVYAAALDNGYMPVNGAVEIDQGQGSGAWRPDNFSSGRPTTLRDALRLSPNTATVRLAQDIGMPLVGEYARRLGVYDELPNYLSYALGAGETTTMRMVTAYSMFANGGRRVKPILIDRIQDRYGRTIFKSDQRECRGCDAPEGWKNQPEPQLTDRRERVLNSVTAYQITKLLEDVVQAGTANVIREVGKPIAGKTGTTNEAKDVWFVGYSRDIAVAIYMGYDKPRPLGRGNAATGGHLAAPIARDFLKLALADKPAIPFKVPAGIKLIRIEEPPPDTSFPPESRHRWPVLSIISESGYPFSDKKM